MRLEKPNASCVKLDLNNEIFQKNLLSLDEADRNRVLDTLKKLVQLDRDQVYRDQSCGLAPARAVTAWPCLNALRSSRHEQ